MKKYIALYVIFCWYLCPQVNAKQDTTKTFYMKEQGALSKKALTLFCKAFEPTIFIETGTYLAHSTIVAAELINPKTGRAVLEEVHTIELSAPHYQQAAHLLSKYPHVTVHHGDSGKILPGVLERLSGKKIIFWLDGHYSGVGTAHGEESTPILKEIEAIKNAGICDAIILVDDIRLFDPHQTEQPGYPSLEQLKQAIYQINREYRQLVIHDVLVAYLPSQKDMPW